MSPTIRCRRPSRLASPPARTHDRARGSAATTALIILALIAVAAVVYFASANSPAIQGVDHQRTIKSLGLGNPVVNGLADRYTDADGDLIADPPTDATQRRDPEVLRFCYLSSAAKNITPEQFDALREHLAAATGRDVVYVEFADGKAQLRALAAGDLDVTGFNTGGVPVAVNVAGFVPCASPAQGGVASTYRMVLITPADSDLRSPADIAGRTLAFTGFRSNSGYKAPLVLLRDQHAMLPDRDYGWMFTYGHDASIRGIADGSLPVAATASDLLAAAVQHGEIAESAYRVLYESEAFPVAALGYAHDLDPALAEQIEVALLSFEPGDGPASEALAGADSIAPLNYKDDYALIRRIDDAAGFEHKLPEADEAPAAPDAPEPAPASDADEAI